MILSRIGSRYPPSYLPVYVEQQSLVRDSLPSDTINPVNLESCQASRQSQRASFNTSLWKANDEDLLEAQSVVGDLLNHIHRRQFGVGTDDLD